MEDPSYSVEPGVIHSCLDPLSFLVRETPLGISPQRTLNGRPNHSRSRTCNPIPMSVAYLPDDAEFHVGGGCLGSEERYREPFTALSGGHRQPGPGHCLGLFARRAVLEDWES